MLACFVSVIPVRGAVSVAIAEAVAATDTLVTTGTVFSVLVDNPATASDLTNAFLGQVMVETASAADAVNGGLIYGVTIDEPVAAADSFGGVVIGAGGGISADVAETATATATQDGTVAGAVAARHAMVIDAFVNSGATSRQGNVNGTMVNL